MAASGCLLTVSVVASALICDPRFSRNYLPFSDGSSVTTIAVLNCEYFYILWRVSPDADRHRIQREDMGTDFLETRVEPHSSLFYCVGPCPWFGPGRRGRGRHNGLSRPSTELWIRPNVG